MLNNKKIVNIIGAGLAGCEAAYFLAEHDVRVRLFEMKTIKKTLCMIMALLTACALCACKDDSSTNTSKSNNRSNASYSVGPQTSTAAINMVKNYMSGTSLSVEQQIASKLGFKKFYSPNYGTETAEQHSSGWKVTIMGKMSGYTDDYNDDFDTRKFKVIADVSQDGKVRTVFVWESY